MSNIYENRFDERGRFITVSEQIWNGENQLAMAEALAEHDAAEQQNGYWFSPAVRETMAAKDWLRENHPHLAIDPEDRRNYTELAAELGRIAGA